MQATTVRPRFRQDLIAELVEEQGQRFIDVGDPDSGNTFRFYEVEYALACAMDGERDIGGIIKWSKEELGVTPASAEVELVISTLSELRFIDTGAPASADLARGVVAAQPKPAARPSADVELGSAGTKSSPAPAPAQASASSEFQLGAPGAMAAKPAASSPVEDIALGTPGARPQPARASKPQSDVSIDLAAHMQVRPDDVKDAVKQSRVMPAVEEPKVIERPVEAKAPAPVEARPSEKRVEAPVAEAKPAPAAAKPADKVVEAPKAEKKADKPASKPAVEVPKRPMTDPSTLPPPPRPGVSPVLVSVLILAVVGVGAFLVYKFVLNKPEEAQPTTKTPPAAVVPAMPPAPPPPAEAKSSIAVETPAAQEIKSTAAGTIESIEPNDKVVKTGDVVATLAGGRPIQAEIATLTRDIERLQQAVDTAQKALADAQQVPDNQKNVDAAQAKLDKAKKPLDEKTAKLTQKQAELDKLAIKAPADGKLQTTAKAGMAVTVDGVVATIQRDTLHVATFKVPPGTKVPADVLNVMAGDKPVACNVIDAQADTIKVKCPPDGLAQGTELRLKL